MACIKTGRYRVKTFYSGVGFGSHALFVFHYGLTCCFPNDSTELSQILLSPIAGSFHAVSSSIDLYHLNTSVFEGCRWEAAL
jgi:hypothetical protein